MANSKKALFHHHKLDEQCLLWQGSLPQDLHFTKEKFQELWDLHPEKYHTIKIHGKTINTPRWQQAYGRNYHYTGSVSNALAIPPILKNVFLWCKENIDIRLNSLLLNWYDGSLGHYIGKHRDDTRQMIPSSPIITISFGEQRIFRLRPWQKKGYKDFEAKNNEIFIIPYTTNEKWTHEVPNGAKYNGKRISVTARAFVS